jgi:ComF family protein
LLWQHGPTDKLWGAVDSFAELMWPTRCVVCDAPGELLCASCRARLPWVEQRRACPDCGMPHGWLACTGCGAEQVKARKPAGDPGIWECRATICALEFAGAGARMATLLKDAHELRLAPVMAAAMATALDEAASWPARDGTPRYDPAALDALCFVPATNKAYVRRGYDHMELVARSLSRLIGVPIADVLVRSSARDQRKLGREERKENLRGTVEVVGDVVGAHLLLIDDVLTTGSTMRETSRALIERGAHAPTACALARVW